MPQGYCLNCGKTYQLPKDWVNGVYGLCPACAEDAHREEYQKVKGEITEAITRIIEKCEHLSMADIKLILHEIAENLNPYIDVEEIE